MSGLVPLKLGDTIKPIAVERYKASKNQKDVISILTPNIQAAHMHFTKGIGGYYCFEGACCHMEGLPTTRYIIPIVKYSMIDMAKFVYGLPVFVQYFSVAKDRYDEILTKNRLNKDITSVDLLVSCTDEAYQKITLDVMGPCLWRQDPNIKKEVKDLYQEYNNLVGVSVARTIDESTFLKLYQEKASDPAQPVPSSTPYTPLASNSLEDSSTEAIDVATDEHGNPNFDDLLAPDDTASTS